MSSRPRPDPAKRIEDLPDSITIGGRAFADLRLLDPVEHQQRVAALHEAAEGCGCVLSAVLGVFAAMVYLAALHFSPALFPAGMWGRIGLGFGVLIVGAGVGKLIGQLHAKRQFDRAAYDLEQRTLALRGARPARSQTAR
jgi:hypothetical protein